jgi:hypothetical protein
MPNPAVESVNGLAPQRVRQSSPIIVQPQKGGEPRWAQPQPTTECPQWRNMATSHTKPTPRNRPNDRPPGDPQAPTGTATPQGACTPDTEQHTAPDNTPDNTPGHSSARGTPPMATPPSAPAEPAPNHASGQPAPPPPPRWPPRRRRTRTDRRTTIDAKARAAIRGHAARLVADDRNHHGTVAGRGDGECPDLCG